MFGNCLGIAMILIALIHQPIANASQGMSNQIAIEIAHFFETISVVIIIASFIVAFFMALVELNRQGPNCAYETARRVFGKGLLLSLEVLIAADLMLTVMLEHAIRNLITLGLLVIIRTILSWSIVIEIEGKWPWRLADNSKNK